VTQVSSEGIYIELSGLIPISLLEPRQWCDHII